MMDTPRIPGLTRRRLRPALVAASIGLATVAAGCASDDVASESGTARTAAEVDVRPFEEIQDSEIVFEADPLDPTSGILRVTTTEESICAVVWGETDSFGRFNNSLAMSGTGIIQHDVSLPDLEQGTEYSYVLQGTTADGSLFRSELDTFTIPVTETAEAAPEPDLGPNLALGATISEVSSVFNDAFVGENAIDGDLGTEWSSTDDGDGAFIVVDLGEPTDITGVAFLTRSMADGTAVTERFTVTTDSGEELGPFPAGNPGRARLAELDEPTTATTLRFTVEQSTGGNVGAAEIQIFAG